MKSKYTKDNSDIRDQVSVLSPQSSGFSGPDPDLGIVIRPDSAGLWMPDHVRHDKSVSLVVDYYALVTL